MSTHAAIAAVTATLELRLTQAMLAAGLAGAEVSPTRPGTSGAFTGQLGAHLYLYMVTPNSALRNADLPIRDGRGGIVNRPTAALDLHYLLSFVGNDKAYEPQRMLGVVAAELHAKPVLTPDEIQNATSTNVALSVSRLEHQIERVKLTPEGIDLEEFSKLWSVLLQTQYILSVSYKASVVLLEADMEPPVAARVRDRGVWSAPMPPNVASLSPQVVGQGGRVVVRGTAFVSASTRVRLTRSDGTMRLVEPELVLDDRIELIMPSDLPAGVLGLSVVTEHEASSGSLDPRAFELESGSIAFMLAPRIVTAADDPQTRVEVTASAGDPVALHVVPVILDEQEVSVLVGSVRVPVPSDARTNVVDQPTQLSFIVPSDPALEPGHSDSLRVVVDRATSLVEVDGTEFKPRLTLAGGP